MTLGKAIDGAFGRTEYVRREAWPAGSVGMIDCLSQNPFAPFSCTLGRTRWVSNRPSDVDLAASDWYPCDIDGKQTTGNRAGVLTATGGADGSIARGNQCEVWLDGSALEGGCTLAWVKPHELSVWVPRERTAAWPDEGMVMPLRQLSVSANGLVRHFHLLGVKWRSLQDDSRLYRLCVSERKQVQ